MKRCWKGALIGGSVGAFYGLTGASQKYPADYWTFDEGIARIGGYAIVFVIVAAIIGYGIGSVSQKSK